MTTVRRATFNNFDLLRIAAALQVLLGHAFLHLQVPTPRWWPILAAFPGVPIFFVISGFLISKSFERSADLGSYVRNRALRIYPALWACIALTVAVASIAGHDFLQLKAAAWIPAQLAGLIYTPAFLETFGFGSYNGSLWTIPIELQFYIMLPLLYGLLRRGPVRFDTGLACAFVFFTAIALAWSATATPWVEGAAEPRLEKLVRYTFAPHFHLFLAGVMLQRMRAEQHRWVVGRGAQWMIGYLAFHFALPANPWTDVTGTLLLAVAVVATAYTMPEVSHRLLRENDLSYGTYIYHGLIINIFLTLGWHADAALIPALVLATIAASLASWKLIEQPCLRLKSRRSAPALAPGDAAPSAGQG